MNRSALRAALDAAHVSPRSYSLDGGLANDTVCLESVPSGHWLVYYTERGSRFDEIEFGSEHDACRYLLGLFVPEHRVSLSEERLMAEDE